MINQRREEDSRELRREHTVPYGNTVFNIICLCKINLLRGLVQVPALRCEESVSKKANSEGCSRYWDPAS
jgi:hypothetical protein